MKTARISEVSVSTSVDPIRIPSTATTGSSKVERTSSSSLSSGPTTVILNRYLFRFFAVDVLAGVILDTP
ncbi:MAG: hypothetical protein ACFFEV_06775 [Candidatus Thorarchaeota archaeon]